MKKRKVKPKSRLLSVPDALFIEIVGCLDYYTQITTIQILSKASRAKIQNEKKKLESNCIKRETKWKEKELVEHRLPKDLTIKQISSGIDWIFTNLRSYIPTTLYASRGPFVRYSVVAESLIYRKKETATLVLHQTGKIWYCKTATSFQNIGVSHGQLIKFLGPGQLLARLDWRFSHTTFLRLNISGLKSMTGNFWNTGDAPEVSEDPDYEFLLENVTPTGNVDLQILRTSN